MNDKTENNKNVTHSDSNFLFPVFLKMEQLNLLIIGGKKPSFEKLIDILANAPASKIKLVSKEIISDIKELTPSYPNLQINERDYIAQDIDEANIIIIAIKKNDTVQQIKNHIQPKEKLAYYLYHPELSDFYLSSVIKKGQLKIAISTNNKSPVIAERLKQVFDTYIPSELDEVVNNLSLIRDKLSGDLDHKVRVLNKVTKGLVEKPDERLSEFTKETPEAAEIIEPITVLKRARPKTNWYLISIGAVLIISLSILALYEFGVLNDAMEFLKKDHHLFYWMLLVGFIAELVAGSMGMGYGVICTSILLFLNIPPPVVSASIHSAESFTTAAGSISHWKLGNTNKKLIKALALPAIMGAIIGALALSYFGEHYAKIVRPFIATYTLYLGINILRNALKKKEIRIIKKKTNIPTLGFLGGFIDSFGGGGWGPLVTGTFIKNGRTPRYVVGSSTVAKFILTITSAITFVFIIGIKHWNIVAGLLLGGIITAPFSAMLTAKLPVKKMFFAVGIIVIIMSLITIIKSIFL